MFKGCHFQPAEPRGLLRSSHIELSRGTAEGRDQRAQVQQNTHPAGGHLHPEDGPAPAEEAFKVGTFIAVGTREHLWSGQDAHRSGEGLCTKCLPASAPLAFLSCFSITTGFIHNSHPCKVYKSITFLYCQMLFRCMGPAHFVYPSSVNRHWRCFHLLAITSDAAMHTHCVQVLQGRMCCLFSWVILRNRTAYQNSYV